MKFLHSSINVVEPPHCDSFHLARLTSLTKLDRHRDLEMYFSASGFGRTLIQGENFLLNQQCAHRVVQTCTMKFHPTLTLMYKIKVWPTGEINRKCSRQDIALFLFRCASISRLYPCQSLAGWLGRVSNLKSLDCIM